MGASAADFRRRPDEPSAAVLDETIEIRRTKLQEVTTAG